MTTQQTLTPTTPGVDAAVDEKLGHEGKDSTAVNLAQAQAQEPAPQQQSSKRRLYELLSYTPRRCRYDPNKPPGFSMALNILFAFAACFTVANLYYNHPILNLLAKDFGVSDEEASYVPTLAQAGYATGLLFLCPLGDLLKRRPFVLWLVWFTATLWIVLCLTHNFHVFLAISYLTSVTTVTPQLMLPLVGDLAPQHRRASALALVVSGLLLGMLVARLLSGVVAYVVGWRVIYWISFGLQYLILILLWLFMPDYPSTNPDARIVKGYPMLLWDIVRFTFKFPVLMQACLIGFFTSSTFTSFVRIPLSHIQARHQSPHSGFFPIHVQSNRCNSGRHLPSCWLEIRTTTHRW
jgi:predicted MFS family arabinose efflux permease